MSLLLDALKRAETQKRRQPSPENISSAVPDIDFSAIDPVALQRNGAKNLFSAKQAGYDNYSKAKQIAALGGIVLLIGAASFYAWYWYNTSIATGSQMALNNRSLPPVEMRGGQAETPTPPPVIETIAPTPADARTMATKPPLPPELKTSKPGVKTFAPSLAAVATKDQLNVLPVITPKSELPVVEKTAKLMTPSAPTAPVPINAIGWAANDSAIKLRRSNEEIYAISPDLGAAYQALVAGRLTEARQKYEMVLQNDPTNIDAELGMATIAAKNNATAEATRRYQRVLELSPKNPYALAGMAALANDMPQTENQLRAQMALQPQSAPLAAALGSVFAAQNRWGEAQQAYFDAVRLDANSPDYVFNLAVSLDQINQPKLALENYQKALSLASVRPNQFNKDVVATRIAELSKIK